MPDIVENSTSSRSSLQAFSSSHRSRADFFSVSKVVLLLYSGSTYFVSVTLIINDRRELGQAIELPSEEPRNHAGARRIKTPPTMLQPTSGRKLGPHPLRRSVPRREVTDN